MSKKRRPSYNSQVSSTSTSSTTNSLESNFLSTRTRKSISKSRRASAVDEKPPSSSRRTSLAAAISLLSLPSFQEQVSTALDVHDVYKVKVSRSCRKLECFFGEPTPVDVCVGEIVKEGLKAMLESKVPLCYFLYYLLDEFSSENLFFFLEVEQFEKQYKKKKSEDQRTMAQRIFDRYITTNASLEINLDDHVKRNIIQYFLPSSSTTPSYVFSEAKTSAYVLLETSFHRFLTSCVYDDMLTNCGELTIHYNERVRGVALNFLVEYLRTQQDLLLMHSENHTALSDTLVRLNSKHYELIKSMIQGFIRNTFGVDYMASKIAAFSIITAAKNSHGSR